MTARDRNILFGVVGLAIAAAFWFLALAPQRDEAATLKTSIAEARTELDTARQGALEAEKAREAYDSDYATVARLGKAVPADDDVPSLVFQLESAAQDAGVDFRSIRLEASGGPAPVQVATPAQNAAAVGAAEKSGEAAPAPVQTPTEAVAAALPPGASIGPAGFPTMPFSFTFQGSFRKLEDFLNRVKRFTRIDGEKIRVSGRLLTIDGLSLMPGPKGFPQMTAQIRATAFVLPADAAPGAAAATPVGGAPAAPGTPTAPATSATPGGTP